ncbi:MAG: MATE family efflux transporter [Bdellovibrionaceae bacterium]|nr:MATE family efflux transporter [Pseudobdellovibrionaceae bacterium]
MEEITKTTDLSIPKTRKEKWKAILLLAWPLIIANSFWNLQLTIDRMYLGNYSTEALGAAMAVMGIFWTPMALLQQTASYLMTFVAQYFGAKQYKMIGPAVWQAIYVSIFGGLLFLLLIPLSETIFEFIGHTQKMRLLEVEYFDAICYSALPTALVAAASSFFTGLSKTRTVMAINAVGLVVNIIFDYLFIFGKFGIPAMGAAGAGYATALANLAAAIYGFYLVFQSKHEQEYSILSGWRINMDLMKRYIQYGIPSGLQWALEGLAFSVFLIFIGRMANGDAALSSSSIVVTVMMLAVLPPMGIAQAVSVLVGQYLGEKKSELAEEAAWSGLQVALMYIAVIGSSFLLIPHFYLSWFYNAENPALWEQVALIVPYLLMYVALFTSFDSMNLIFSFTLKGAGDTKFVSLVALLLPWPLMVLPTYFMKDWDGAVYWAWGAASVFIITQALVFWYRFAGGKWKTMSVIN